MQKQGDGEVNCHVQGTAPGVTVSVVEYVAALSVWESGQREHPCLECVPRAS